MTDRFETEGSVACAALSWRIIFCDPEPLDPETCGWRERAFYRSLHLLKPGFRHCFLMRPLAADDGGWLIVNPNSARMDVFEVLDNGDGTSGYAAYVNRLARAGKVRVLDVPQLYPAGLVLRPWFSCVEVVKHATGLRPPVWVLTPWQLYRWIGCRAD